MSIDCPGHTGMEMLSDTVKYPLLKEGACKQAQPQSRRPVLASTLPTIGSLTTALARMFRAALRSAFAEWPHRRHSKADWPLRLAFSQWPHSLQVRLVSRGSTSTTGTPANAAL